MAGILYGRGCLFGGSAVRLALLDEAALGGAGERFAVLVHGLRSAAVISGIPAGQALFHECLALVPFLSAAWALQPFIFSLLGLLGSGRFLLRGISLLLFSKGGACGKGEGNQGNGEVSSGNPPNGVMGTAWELRRGASQQRCADYRRGSYVIVKQRALLAVDEFLHAVDAAQLEDGVAYRGFEQDGKVAAGSDRNDDLAYGDAEDFLRLRIQRAGAGVGTGDGLLQVMISFEASSCGAKPSRRRWYGC